MNVQLNDMKDGEIRAISNAVCVAKKNGEFFAFSRYCSHEGADLSLGYVDEENIRCPWHNLPFNLKTCQQPCQSLKNLKKYEVKENSDGSFEIKPI